MQYAPVIIPTLNRYDHFKKCLESLEKCTGADKTEVYIGLDYPPSDKYVDGWKKIDEYLANKETENGFNKLIVFRRDHNCGVGGPKSNSALLHQLMNDNYDSYIMSEDDNVFSPNFLEYMNKCLERYENDSSVFAVTGYCHPYPFNHSDNSIFMHQTDVSCWGIGLWTKKEQEFKKLIKEGFFENNFSIKNILKIKKFGYNRLYQYLTYVFRDKSKYFWLIDCVMSCYIALSDKYIVVPTISKVRNIGWDELGNSFFKNPKILKKYGGIAETHKAQQIDESSEFHIFGDPTTYIDHNNNIAVQNSDGHMSFGDFFVNITKFFVRRIFLS